MKIQNLNIVMTYPVYWTKYQVLRDFIQNFYDAIDNNLWRKDFCYEYIDKRLSMWVKNETFNYEWLMHIGASTKTNNENGYAGFFGEGFKIASLCAFRDYDWKIQMMSDDWHIDVIEIEKTIDRTSVSMLAYNVSTVEKKDETKLVLNNISTDDYELFLTAYSGLRRPVLRSKTAAMRSKRPLILI